jgi:hypothetical protein
MGRAQALEVLKRDGVDDLVLQNLTGKDLIG